ncbi:hypothetical protein EPUL_000330 [Erysiphe pulchra]|uniref:Uncharacterized protein n=1 Tax=Erysiphe pulchra TaxID=225359 RepID=A0A2S4Q1D0_9PEZI|nr:hypothetical protein EPUL_000330 [Erysiphe pulchra]
MDLESYERNALRRHLGFDNSSRDLATQETSFRSPAMTSPVSFIVERSPPSIKPAKCSFPCCSQVFVSGRYRVAVSPAMKKNAAQNVDLYHVSCFERIADLSDSAFLERIEPFTRFTNVNRPQEDYICAGAVERLVNEWKTRRIRWNTIVKNSYEEEEQNSDDEDDIYDGENEENNDDSEDDDVDEEICSRTSIQKNQFNERLLDDLMHNAGSSRFKPYGLVPGMQRQQYFLFLKSLAPWESDGPGDTQEWNLFDTFLGQEESDRTRIQPNVNLSAVLEKWEKWVELVLTPDTSLNHEQLKEKAGIGEKGCRAIRRLAVIPLQQIPWQF